MSSVSDAGLGKSWENVWGILRGYRVNRIFLGIIFWSKCPIARPFPVLCQLNDMIQRRQAQVPCQHCWGLWSDGYQWLHRKPLSVMKKQHDFWFIGDGAGYYTHTQTNKHIHTHFFTPQTGIHIFTYLSSTHVKNIPSLNCPQAQRRVGG